jgi:membrane glycosyltransferase
LICPIMWINQSIFLIRLALGRSRGWAAQTRDDHIVTWYQAFRLFWPHTLFGIIGLTLILQTHPTLIAFALLYLAGPALAIPFAVLSSWPGIGMWMVRKGLAQLPEETDPPEELLALDLAALQSQRSRA